MDAVTELLNKYYTLGSEPYYRTLYLKENKQQTQLFILLHDIIFTILHSSDDANVRLQKLHWWAEECEKSLFSSTPCSKRVARHPITQALISGQVNGKVNGQIDGKVFTGYLNEISQISHSKTASDSAKKTIHNWLITALSPTIEGEIKQQLSTILYNYQTLKNTAINFSYGYKFNNRLPKYLNADHLNGKNEQVIIDYIQAEQALISSQLQQLKGHKLPQVFITQLLLMQNVLNKIKKQPKSIYNNKEQLTPIKQLFISYFAKNKQVF